MKKIMIVFGMLILFVAEILRVYFIMPFPGSQKADTINIAYFLHKNISYIRLASFHVWNRQVNDFVLQFVTDSSGLEDINTQSSWNYDGLCTDGQLKGAKLKPVQASQEFWHSWQTFHPNTTLYNKK